MDPGELRNLKEFLLLYNKISEDCFKKCVYDMTLRDLPPIEGDCISTCVQKHINFNHKTMELFSEINPAFQQRKVLEREEEFRKMQEEAANNAALGEKVPWYTSIFGIGGGKTVATSPTPVATQVNDGTSPEDKNSSEISA